MDRLLMVFDNYPMGIIESLMHKLQRAIALPSKVEAKSTNTSNNQESAILLSKA